MNQRKNFFQRVVYLATNKSNGRRYIGATTRGIHLRRQQHDWDSKKAKSGCRLFNKALRKYGKDGFEWTVLAECNSDDELWLKEAEYIIKIQPEYNIMTSGDGEKGVRRRLGCKTISKPVKCLNDGKIHSSGAAASRYYNVPQMSVSSICRRGGETRGGLKFMFADADAPVERAPKTPKQIKTQRDGVLRGLSNAIETNQKPVVCIDTGAQFKSISEAAAAYGLGMSSVAAAIKRNGRCGGKRFRFSSAPEMPPDGWRFGRKPMRATLKGAYRRPSGRWSATIYVDGQSKHLGTFDTEVEAHEAYKLAVATAVGSVTNALAPARPCRG